MKLRDRLKAETPPLWKKIGNWSLIGGAILSGITLGLDQSGLDVKIFGLTINPAMNFLGVALGAIGKALSSLQVKK